ncbi:hypothetical protein [Taibaiella chishuiensis]|uniref:Uncharacterized protein n=1 Tax=Taibaiella chishuiensis TaxID=1434707 RepID=A0A2P8D0N4_9BACT|nr:hypothetical protein [Taibaiella chishuiensis]PSK90774.1 hypothetical protein B0I18_107186 [Taibaiella chishuiensis]
MNEKNVEYLGKQLFYTGMEDIPQESLVRNIQEGKPGFVMELIKENISGEAKGIPYFRQSDKGNYFFNNFDMVTTPKGLDPIIQSYWVRKAEPIIVKDANGVPVKDEHGNEQKEWINNTITYAQAANLGFGRAINKTYVKVNKEDPSKNEKYNTWQVLDFKNPDANGKYPLKNISGYDIDKVLTEYNFKELATEKGVKDFSDSLKRGNCQSATYVHPDGAVKKLYVEAHPLSKTSLKIYDANMVRINLSMKRPKIKEGQELVPDQQQNQVEIKDNKVKESLTPPPKEKTVRAKTKRGKSPA